MISDVRDSYLSSSGRLIGAVGVANLIVVETTDAILVADKERVQDVKAIVNQVKAGNRPEAIDQGTVSALGEATNRSIMVTVSR